MEIISTALTLAGPLSRLATALIGRSNFQRNEVASYLERISQCAREIAQLLRKDVQSNVNEKLGNMEHYADDMRRVFGDLTSESDVERLSSRIKSAIQRLSEVQAMRGKHRAKEFVNAVRELEFIAGRFGAQAETIRQSQGQGPNLWTRFSPAFAKMGSGMAAGLTVAAAISDISLEKLGDNYDAARGMVGKVFRKKLGDDDLDSIA